MSEVADVGGKERWKTPSVVQVFEVQTWQKYADICVSVLLVISQFGAGWVSTFNHFINGGVNKKLIVKSQ